MRKLYFFVLIFLIIVIVFLALYNRETNITKTDFAFDTIIKISAQGKNAKNAVNASFEAIKTYEKLFSVYDENSEVTSLNKNKKGALSGDVSTLIKNAYTYSEATDGYFDITVKPLIDLWNIKEGSFVPTDDEINKTLASVNYKNVVLNGNNAELINDASIDLGGIAKGYCCDKVFEIMKQHDIKEAVIDMGGNIYVLGDREFKIGIQDPDGERGDYFGICHAKNTSVVTSGAYERYFIKDGKMYHHILNPFNGKCADSGIKSVTIVGTISEKCDAYSTAVYTMGVEKGIEALSKQSDLDYIIVDNENNVYISENINFEITNDNYKLK